MDKDVLKMVVLEKRILKIPIKNFFTTIADDFKKKSIK